MSWAIILAYPIATRSNSVGLQCCKVVRQMTSTHVRHGSRIIVGVSKSSQSTLWSISIHLSGGQKELWKRFNHIILHVEITWACWSCCCWSPPLTKRPEVFDSPTFVQYCGSVWTDTEIVGIWAVWFEPKWLDMKPPLQRRPPLEGDMWKLSWSLLLMYLFSQR